MPKLPKKTTMRDVVVRAMNYTWKMYYAGKLTKAKLNKIIDGLDLLLAEIKKK